MDPRSEPLRQLAEAATSRADALEDRVRDLEVYRRGQELAEARREGAAGGVQRLAPWVAIVATAITILLNVVGVI
jgi:hypothetical protein